MSQSKVAMLLISGAIFTCAGCDSQKAAVNKTDGNEATAKDTEMSALVRTGAERVGLRNAHDVIAVASSDFAAWRAAQSTLRAS